MKGKPIFRGLAGYGLTPEDKITCLLFNLDDEYDPYPNDTWIISLFLMELYYIHKDKGYIQ